MIGLEREKIPQKRLWCHVDCAKPLDVFAKAFVRAIKRLASIRRPPMLTAQIFPHGLTAKNAKGAEWKISGRLLICKRSAGL
jgi:hypothetical protein